MEVIFSHQTDPKRSSKQYRLPQSATVLRATLSALVDISLSFGMQGLHGFVTRANPKASKEV